MVNDTNTRSPPTATSRSRVQWQFSVGQMVAATEIGPALVIARGKIGLDGETGAYAGEIYKVRPYIKGGPWRDKTVPSTCLRAIEPGGADCADCLLGAVGICHCDAKVPN